MSVRRSRRISRSSWWESSPDDPAMARARQAILGAGGAHECNSFTRFYLALLGQIGYDDCPCVPPELVLIPSRLNFSLSAMSAWTRTIVVPLSIMSYFKPVRVSARRAWHRRAVPGRPRPAVAPHGPLVFLDELLPRGRPRAQVARSPGARRLAAAGDPGGASLDARSLRKHRRPGRDLPADGLFDHRPAMPGLRPGFAGRAVGDEAARRPAHRRGRPDPRAALPLAGLGHGDRHDRAGRCQGAVRSSRVEPRGPVAARQGSAKLRATGRSAVRASSRPAGTSSSTTRFIPISTTARWCCLP